MTEKEKTRRSKDRKDQELHLRLTRAELNELQIASYATEESMSDIVRKALKMYLSGIKGAY